MPQVPGRTVEIGHCSRPVAMADNRQSDSTSFAEVKQKPNLLPIVLPILGIRKMNVLLFSEVQNYPFEQLGINSSRDWP